MYGGSIYHLDCYGNLDQSLVHVKDLRNRAKDGRADTINAVGGDRVARQRTDAGARLPLECGATSPKVFQAGCATEFKDKVGTHGSEEMGR